MIIPSFTSLGNNIDVYLQPLIEELNQLWGNGVETHVVSLEHKIFICVQQFYGQSMTSLHMQYCLNGVLKES